MRPLNKIYQSYYRMDLKFKRFKRELNVKYTFSVLSNVMEAIYLLLFSLHLQVLNESWNALMHPCNSI